MGAPLAQSRAIFAFMMPEIPPPPDKVPDYVLYGRRYNRPYLPRPKKLAPEIPAAVHVHPDLESALLAAKRGARYKSGCWFGRMGDGDGFCVFYDGRVVEKHIVQRDI